MATQKQRAELAASALEHFIKLDWRITQAERFALAAATLAAVDSFAPLTEEPE